MSESKHTPWVVNNTFSCLSFSTGKGTPNSRAVNSSRISRLDDDLFPQAAEANIQYRAELGTTLKEASEFADNPFTNEETQRQCEDHLASNFPPPHELFSEVVNGNYMQMHAALKWMIQALESSRM